MGVHQYTSGGEKRQRNWWRAPVVQLKQLIMLCGLKLFVYKLTCTQGMMHWRRRKKETICWSWIFSFFVGNECIKIDWPKQQQKRLQWDCPTYRDIPQVSLKRGEENEQKQNRWEPAQLEIKYRLCRYAQGKLKKQEWTVNGQQRSASHWHHEKRQRTIRI